jgi:hypothetical protein
VDIWCTKSKNKLKTASGEWREAFKICHLHFCFHAAKFKPFLKLLVFKNHQVFTRTVQFETFLLQISLIVERLLRSEAVKVPPALGMELGLAAMGAEESCVSLEVEVSDEDLLSGR